jgi:maltose O-acetyltransferase
MSTRVVGLLRRYDGDTRAGARVKPPSRAVLDLRRRLFARLRGEQTLTGLRRRGLRAGEPLQLASEGAIDPRFAWAIEIGSQTIIAGGVRIVAHDAAIKRLTGFTEVRPVTIGQRCYIGAGAIVLPGATIGDDAVIGAGAIVRGEIPAGALAVGNPARVVGQVDELCERHMSLISSTPHFDVYPKWFSASQQAAMRTELRRHGRVYVR